MWPAAEPGAHWAWPTTAAWCGTKSSRLRWCCCLRPASWLWIALAFGLFRLFDILKPWPIRIADARLKNGFGVMFDDLLAAAYAIAALKGLQWLV